MEDIKFDPRVIQAAIEYVARREKRSKPSGFVSKADGCWYMHYEEGCSCCDSIMTPKEARRAWNLYHHALSVEHVSNLFDADLKQVKKAVKLLKAGGKLVPLTSQALQELVAA